MIGNFKIDQATTFNSVHLMSVEPKTKFKSDQQEQSQDGTPKWQAKVAVTYSVFGRNESEILNVNMASRNDPGDGVAPFSPVKLEGLEVNVGPKTDRDNKPVPGIQQWYRADAIKAVK
jgi:hypothetical protein